jgi:peptide/nickel transport system substrate-binding protein
MRRLHTRTRSRPHHVGVAAAIAAMALLAAACSSSGSSDQNATSLGKPTVQLPPASGSFAHLVWALPAGEPNSIDPTKGSDLSPTFVTSNLCDSLLKETPSFQMEPNLAVSYQHPNSLTYIYNLRHGVRFWNGHAMTSADVVWSLQHAARPASYVSVFFQNVKSISANGPYQVVVRFNHPDALFNREMAGVTSDVMEKSFSEQEGSKLGAPGGGMMCTGPYELVSWKAGQSIELKANPHYWNPDLQPKAKTVSLRFLSDSGALVAALKSGEVDGAYEVPPAIIPALEKSSAGTLHTGPSTAYMEFDVLRDAGPLANPQVRAALMWSIDRQGLADVVFHGTAAPNYTYVATNSFPADTRTMWDNAYQKYKTSHTLTISQAKELVTAAHATGETVQLTTLAGDATQSEVAQLIQQTGAQIGLKVKIDALQPTQYSEMFVNSKLRAGYDAAFSTSFNGIPDPLEPIPFEVTTHAFYNYVGYSNKQVDQDVAEALHTFDRVKQTQLLLDAQNIYEQHPWMTSLLSLNEVMYLNNRLGGAVTSFAYLGLPSLAYIGQRDQ